MDLITIGGAVASVVGVINSITKTINSLRDLHNRWKIADLTVVSLISQLATLRAALNKISEWISTDLAGVPQHHQLVIDLEDSVSCCRLLTKSIDAQLSKLDRNPNNALQMGSKIRVIFDDKATKHFRTLIESQTSALALLLTACNCKTTSEQKALLEEPRSREIFDQIKDDSSSLFVLCDSDSCFDRWTRSTEKSSKLSMTFPFDFDLLRSRVYQRAVRSVFRYSVRHRIGALYEKDKRMTDKEYRRMRRKEYGVLMLGNLNSEWDKILELMKILHRNGHARKEPAFFKEKILSTVVDLSRTVWQHYADDGMEIDDSKRKHVDIVFRQTLPLKHMTANLSTSIKNLWSTLEEHLRSKAGWPNLIDFILIPGIDVDSCYFLEQLNRLMEPGYIPNGDDILHIERPLKAEVKETEIEETKIPLGRATVHFTRIYEQQSDSREFALCMHQFDHTHALLFVVDLNLYDTTLPETRTATEMTDTLALFSEIVSFRRLRRPFIILLLSNFDLFKEKIRQRPLVCYFPDYSGGSNAQRAAQYIVSRFEQANFRNLKFHPHLISPEKTPTTSFVLLAIHADITNAPQAEVLGYDNRL